MSDQPAPPPGRADEADWANIHTAIVRVMAELPAIGKDATMNAEGARGGGPTYKYRSIEAILPHVTAAFARHGVHIEPHYKVLKDERYQSSNSSITRVVIEGLFLFRAADGTCTSARTIGEARDTYDKAFNKAMTAALKYALIQVLGINDGEDPDHTQPPVAESWESATPARAVQAQQAGVDPASNALANSDTLKNLGPKLDELGLRDELTAWVEVRGIDIRRRVEAQAGIARVIAHAHQLIEAAEAQRAGSDPVADAAAQLAERGIEVPAPENGS